MDLITLFLISDFSESKSKKAEKMSATTSTQTPTTVRSGDASSGSSVVAKKSAVVSADSIANKSQKGIVVGNGGEVNGVSAMKEKKINLKVAPRRQRNFYDSTPCFRQTYRVTIQKTSCDLVCTVLESGGPLL